MGLLKTGGKPMGWGSEENERGRQYVRDHGVDQFLCLYEKYKNVENCPFLWGEEVEHMVLHIDREKKVAKVSLRGEEVLKRLETADKRVAWRPEYGCYMIESVPADPYTDTLASMCDVEHNMQIRNDELFKFCDKDQTSVTLVSHPLLGVGTFTEPAAAPGGPFSESLFIPDAVINSHPRFGTLTQNIRLRRGRKVCIQIPLFLDKNTQIDKQLNIDANDANGRINCGVEATNKSSKIVRKKKQHTAGSPGSPPSTPTGTEGIPGDLETLCATPANQYYFAQYSSKKDVKLKNVKARFDACPCPTEDIVHPCIYMDCMAFGMGLNCLQMTMQMRNITESRHVYDQLAVLCPIFLALSAATPFQKGLLCDSDVRWMTISSSVDCRKREEVPKFIKSRYDSISTYLSPITPNLDEFNDVELATDDATMAKLKKHGLDDVLARHVSHLFIRDPLVIFDNRTHEVEDEHESDHFENIQSTNWQSVRFKPPPPGQDAIGWRVEFRVTEVQPTAFENAAYTVFVALLARAIIKYKLGLYLPISLNDENIGQAHRREPLQYQYYFRKNIRNSTPCADPKQWTLMTVDEIINGGKHFEGLMSIANQFLDEEPGSKHEKAQIRRYLKFLSLRAARKIPTTADYLRNFIVSHPDYKQDSKLTDSICFDIVEWAEAMAKGNLTDDSYIPRELFYGPPAGHQSPKRQPSAPHSPKRAPSASHSPQSGKKRERE